MRKIFFILLLCLPLAAPDALINSIYYLTFDKNPPEQNVTSYTVNCNDAKVVYSTSTLIDEVTAWRTPNDFCGNADGDYHVTIVAANSAGASPPSNGVDFFIAGGEAYHPPTSAPDAPVIRLHIEPSG